jgi:hypothetical protein
MILLYFAVSFLFGLLLLQGLNRLVRTSSPARNTPSVINVSPPANRIPRDADHTLPALNLALFSSRQPAKQR